MTTPPSSVAVMKLSKAEYIELCNRFRDGAQQGAPGRPRIDEPSTTRRIPTSHSQGRIRAHQQPEFGEVDMQSADIQNIPVAPLTGERFTAAFGPNVPVTVSAGNSETGPAVFILTPHMAAPEGVGFIHTLSQDDAAQLIAALYASLTPAGQLQAVAALGNTNGKD